MDRVYDVIILGAGPAGLAAGLYAGRSRLSVLIIEKGIPGGQIATTNEIENYPGQMLEGETGPSLVARMSEQAVSFGAEKITDTINEVSLTEEIKVLTGTKDTYYAKSIIIATGAQPRPIGCKNETDYIVLESDIAWNDIYNTPDDDYRAYRRMWMKLCANISQIGKPCVVCGACTPKQFENLPERELFSDMYYLAVVCDDETMMQRMTVGRKVTDENWIASSMQFNNWLKENHDKTEPNIDLLDTSNLTPEQAAEYVDRWIKSKLTKD